MIEKVIFLILGGVIGFTFSCFTWKLQTRYEKKNIARALYIGISSLEDRLKAFVGTFKNPLFRDNPIKVNQPFYDTEGLFFNFRKEISSFNKDLSNSLFEFYTYLIRAEEFRQIEDSDMFFKEVNKAMKDYLEKAYNLLPRLKKLLEN